MILCLISFPPPKRGETYLCSFSFIPEDKVDGYWVGELKLGGIGANIASKIS